MRKIKDKNVQVHYECVCGFNSVDTESFPIRWKDFAKNGIKRRKDKKTKKTFLVVKIDLNCKGEGHYNL
jgi:hypothetical protein